MSKKGMLEMAVEKTDDVKGYYQTGLKALGKNANKIACGNPKLLGGSLDIDKVTKKLYPTDERWDYAVEYNGKVYFVEVHPAYSGEVKKVIAKLNWLKQWLKNKAPEIDGIKSDINPYRWVYTGQYAIIKSDRYTRLLAQNGIQPPVQECKLF